MAEEEHACSEEEEEEGRRASTPSFSAWESPPREQLGAQEHWHTDRVEEQRSGGTEHPSPIAWDSASWEQNAPLMHDTVKELSKMSEFSSCSPSFLQDEAFSSLQNVTDSECSDVDLDNDWVSERGSDSEFAMETLDSQKESKWLRPFFAALNDVAAETQSGREDVLFYCPACRGSGLGETDLYKGLKPLITHARNYTKRRVKLHKQFAFILEEDMKKGNPPMADHANPFSQQRLAIEDLKLAEPCIVWPPMVVLRTCAIKPEMHKKRITMETKHLLEVFKDYYPKRVRCAYDSESHLGLLSLLIFQETPVGYMHAKHLVKKFKCSGKGRKQWDEYVTGNVRSSCVEFMYAYMATPKDLAFFETCNSSKKKFTWSIRSFKEVIIQPMVDLSEAKLKNCLLKAQLQDQEEHNKFLEKFLSKLHGNLELTEYEAHAVQRLASQI